MESKKLTGGLSEGELRAKTSEQVQALESEIQEKDKILKDYRQSHGKLEVFFRRVESAIAPFQPEPIVFSPKQARSSVKSAIVMHSSDQHDGAVQEANEIEGFGENNPEITRRRKVGMAYDFLRYHEFQSYGFNLNELVILDTGDNVSGDIHDELKITNAYPTPVQCVRAAINSAIQVQILAPHFEKVTYHFIGSDNHGRLTKKPQSKEEGKNSFNYLVGVMLGMLLSKHSNVDFRLYPQYEKVVQVLNRNYLCTHAHGIRGWAGIPWYGLERKVGKESTARMQKIMEQFTESMEEFHKRAKEVGFHKFVHGHFHTPYSMPMLMGGGSVSGTDAHDHKEGRFGNPTQTGWIVHPENKEQSWQVFDLSRHTHDTKLDSNFGIDLIY